MIDVVNISDRGQITIPARLRDALNLSEGDRLLLTKVGTTLVIYTVDEGLEKISDLYASIKPRKGKSTNPDVAIRKAKDLKVRQNKVQDGR